MHTRAHFRDTEVCQGADWQFSLPTCPWTLVSQGKMSMSSPFFLVFSDSPTDAEQVPMHLWQGKQDMPSYCRMQGSGWSLSCKCNQFCYLPEKINTLLTDYYFNPWMPLIQIPYIRIPEPWNFCVRRQCLLQNIWENLKSASNLDFRKMLKVRY